jgi:hypothetical protein
MKPAFQHVQLPPVPAGASVTVLLAGDLSPAGGLVDAADAAMANPFETADGNIYFRAPSGQYFVDIEKAGWNSDEALRVGPLTFADRPTEEQAEDIADTTGTLYSWSILRLLQLVTAWWATIKTILGQYDTLTAYVAGATPATVTLDYALGNAFFIDRVTNNPADLTIALNNWPTGAGKAALCRVYLECGTQIGLSLPAGFLAVVPTASKTNRITLESYYNSRTEAMVYVSSLKVLP